MHLYFPVLVQVLLKSYLMQKVTWNLQSCVLHHCVEHHPSLWKMMPFMFLSSTKSTGLSSWCGLWFIKLNPSRNSTFPVKFILPIKPSIIHAIAPGERGCSILGSLIPRFSMRRRSLVTDFLSRALNFLLQPPISLASSFLKNLAWS